MVTLAKLNPLWLKFKAALAMLPYVGLLSALAVAGFFYADARHWRKQANSQTERAVKAETDLAIKNAESAKRAEAYEAAKAANAANTAAADARYAASEARRARLRDLAVSAAGKHCKAPEALLDALEGL